jgi:hypothetical protein
MSVAAPAMRMSLSSWDCLKHKGELKMTSNAIVPGTWEWHPEAFYDCCPFDLVAGPDGRWLLWWAEENNWIASFPSLEVAYRIILGTKSWHSQPGLDGGSFPPDIKVALKRQQRKTGKLPQFEFSETSNSFDLYVPLGLGFEALARMRIWEVEKRTIDQRMIDNYCPLVAQCLSASKWDLTSRMVARLAPIVTELLLRQTKVQSCMREDQHGYTRPMLPALKASKVRKMKEEQLRHIVAEYDLDTDLDKFSTRYERRNAVVEELAALGLLCQCPPKEEV